MAAAAALSELGPERARSLLLFAGGRVAEDALGVARGARAQAEGPAIAVVAGPSVLVSEGETDGTVALALDVPIHGAIGDEPAEVAKEVRHRPTRPVLLFGVRTLTPRGVTPFLEASGAYAIGGGGVHPGGTLAFARSNAAPRAGATLALRFDGGVRMATASSVAVRPLGEPGLVEELEDGFVVKVAGESPLARLRREVEERHDRPLVLAVLERGESRFVRGIGGIDPAKGGLHVGDDVVRGDRLCFAVPHPAGARGNLDEALRSLDASLCGGVPLAALAFESVGRGTQLHGRPDVEVRALRRHYGEDVPFAGVRTVSELVRAGEEVALAAHTGTLALLFAPS